MKFYLLLFFILQFQTSLAIEIRPLSTADTWSEARSMCLELGDNWDLPKVSEVIENFEVFEIYNFYLYKESKFKPISKIQLIWAKSDEEELNQQLVLKSQVMKVMNKGLNLDSVLHSNLRTYRLRSFRNLLIENINDLSFVEAESSSFNLFDIYSFKEFSEAFKMTQDKPFLIQLQDLALDLDTFVSYKILILFSKPSRSDIEMEIENLGQELEVLERGLQVICVHKE